MSPIRPHTPPEWWNENLYDFLEHATLDAWFWEFMRRKALLKLLGDGCVDAMNPNPDKERISPNFWDFFNCWTYSVCPERDNQRHQFFVPSAVDLYPREGWSENFRGQQYQLSGILEHEYAKISIDLKRRDKVILRDFKAVLANIRENHPEPRRINPRFGNWYDNKILMVWDLKQQGASYAWIGHYLFEDCSETSRQSAINALQSAKNQIERGGFKQILNLL